MEEPFKPTIKPYMQWELPEGKKASDYYHIVVKKNIYGTNTVTIFMEMSINDEEEFTYIRNIQHACLWDAVEYVSESVRKSMKQFYVKACVRHPAFTYDVKSPLWPLNYFKGVAIPMMGHPKLPPEYTLIVEFVAMGDDEQPLPYKDHPPFSEPERFVDEDPAIPTRITPTFWHTTILGSPMIEESLYTLYLDYRMIEKDPNLTWHLTKVRSIQEIAKRYIFDAFLSLNPKAFDEILVDIEIDDGRFKASGDKGKYRDSGWRIGEILPHNLVADQIENQLTNADISDRFLIKLTYAILPQFIDHRAFSYDTSSKKSEVCVVNSTTMLAYLNRLTPKERTCIEIQDLFQIHVFYQYSSNTRLESALLIQDTKKYVLYNMTRAEALGILLIDLATEILQKAVTIQGKLELGFEIAKPNDPASQFVLPYRALNEYEGGTFLQGTIIGNGEHITGPLTVKLKFALKSKERENTEVQDLFRTGNRYVGMPDTHTCFETHMFSTEYNTYLCNIRCHPLVEEIPPQGRGQFFAYRETCRIEHGRFLGSREYIMDVDKDSNYSDAVVVMVQMILPFMQKFISKLCLQVAVSVKDVDPESEKAIDVGMVDAPQLTAELITRKDTHWMPRQFILRVFFLGPHTNRVHGLVDKIVLEKELMENIIPVDYDKAAEIFNSLTTRGSADEEETSQKA